MDGYAIAQLKSVRMGQDIVEYLRRIDATLAPFGGRFVVHGGHADIREGEFRGDLIVIGFPSREAAVSWYESDAYQEILPLRLHNAEGWAIIVDGVSDDHRATDVLEGSAPAG
ncbi:MAG TPA: DUF1330 domain-containing protein [Thermoleophilaceae bacterium]|nr:DUF1330 domain-containing protein [Thermoleophilaceae bacterium]